ncbi:MAG TPA: hypothetical protein VK783_08625 [Bacteroidia bacterium]|jgi:hypothetical protein|nr:hypothetical protein [Bacteroidia bacterium]
MLKKEFNSLSLEKRSKLVFSQGKLIDIYQDHTKEKAFFYKVNDLKVDVTYDKIRNALLDVIAWDTNNERAAFLR